MAEAPARTRFVELLAPAVLQAARVARTLEGKVANRPKSGEGSDGCVLFVHRCSFGVVKVFGSGRCVITHPAFQGFYMLVLCLIYQYIWN